MKRLLVGYKAGDLTHDLLAGETTCYTLDIYYAHAISRVYPSAKVICTPHLPQDEWDEIRFLTGPKLMSGELALDLLQEIHLLKPKKFILDYMGKERDRNDLISKIKDDPKRIREFASTWPASVPGGEKLKFTSYPGCFCHRRMDEGGLALAEVVTRELTGNAKVLDMGAGCGLVGLLIAKKLANISLTMVDSHTRAIEAATLNAKNFGVEAEIILSDDGTPKDSDGTFDVFVGNPPYYSDYRIAEVFLATAKRALKKGGVAYLVCKNAAGLEPIQKRYFSEVAIISRRGYSVLKSVMV